MVNLTYNLGLTQINSQVKFETYDNNYFYPYIDPSQWSTQPEPIIRSTLESIFKVVIILIFILMLT